MARIIEALTAELGWGPLLYRYSGVDEEEGALMACTFWMVEALAITGQIQRGRQLMGEAIFLRQ